MQKARFLDKGRTLRKLSGIAARIKKKNPNVNKIILFGSLVSNEYTLRSDADIVIILKKDSARFIDRIPKFLLLFADAPVPVDVFPYTEEESKTVPLAKKALANGIVLA